MVENMNSYRQTKELDIEQHPVVGIPEGRYNSTMEVLSFNLVTCILMMQSYEVAKIGKIST